MQNFPDKWVVVKITAADDEVFKVFASWRGGYLGSDSWQMNSGIVGVRQEGNNFLFDGYSGSVYSCGKEAYGTTMYGFSVLHGMMAKAGDQGITMEVLPEETDWLNLLKLK